MFVPLACGLAGDGESAETPSNDGELIAGESIESNDEESTEPSLDRESQLAGGSIAGESTESPSAGESTEPPLEARQLW